MAKCTVIIATVLRRRREEGEENNNKQKLTVRGENDGTAPANKKAPRPTTTSITTMGSRRMMTLVATTFRWMGRFTELGQLLQRKLKIKTSR